MCWLCEHPGATDDDYDNRLRELIAEYGLAVQGVEDDGVHPPWAYTVGLTEHGLPELVVTGLDLVRATRLLNEAADIELARGAWLPGTQLRLPPGGWLAEVVTVAVPDAHLRMATRLFGDAVIALQLVLTDGNGRWPWADDYQGGPGGQPVLGIRGRETA